MTYSPKDSADRDIREAFSKALEDMRGLGQRINNTTASTENVWFRNLLLGIVDCALKDHHNAKSGIQKFVPLAAWATRNLLELRIVTTYVLKSANKANQFKSELMIDVKEFYENVSMSAVASHEKLVAMMCEVAEQEQGPIRDVFMKLADTEAAKEPQTEIANAEAEACRKVLMSEFGIRDSQQPKMHGLRVGIWALQISTRAHLLYPRGRSKRRLVRRQDAINPMAREKAGRESAAPNRQAIELIDRALMNSSKSGDIVVDLFGGSGSTMIACERRNRRARLMEIDPKYADCIVRRWQEHSGEKATLEVDGRSFDEIARERQKTAAWPS